MRKPPVWRVVAAAGAVVAGLFVVSGAPPAGAAATGLPAGFVDDPVAAIASVTSLTPLANGNVLTTSQPGQVNLINPATKAVTGVSVPGLAVCSTSERGLLGAAQDPANAASIFLYYTANLAQGCKNRVQRFALAGNTLTGLETIIDNIPSQAGNHNGGDIHIGKDGFLYIAVGDSGCNPRNGSQCAAGNPAAKDLSLPSGKILRVTLTGDPAPGNPFLTAPGNVSCKNGPGAPGQVCREIYSFGLRNPFRLAPDPNAAGARFAINDVGQNTWEEVDELTTGGANYGWNDREGPCVTGSTTNCGPPPAGVTNPFLAYNRSTGCSAITAGAWVPNGLWPGYDGTYMYADLTCGKLFLGSPLCGSWTSSTFASNVANPVELQFVGNQLWYSSYAGEVRRILPPAKPAGGPTGRYVPIASARKLDTRFGIGGPAGKVPAGGTRTVALTPEVPAGATAAVVNVTLTESNGLGYVTAWPTGQAMPLASTLNASGPNQTVPNTALVAINGNAQLNLFASAGGHLIVDVYGYFAPAATATAGRYQPLAPDRILDTRNGIGSPKQPVLGQRDVQVTGVGGVPAGAAAVALVLTGTDPVAPSFVTAWAAGQPQPATSNLNLAGPGDTRANLVVVPVGAGGKISLFAERTTQLIADVAGWFTGAGAPSSGSGLFVPTTPNRLLDTREAGRPLTRLVGGRTCTIGAGWAVPGGTSAIALNATGDRAGGWGYLTAFPGFTGQPVASNLNTPVANATVAAQTITRFGGGATLSYFASVAMDLVLDVTGWFTA